MDCQGHLTKKTIPLIWQAKQHGNNKFHLSFFATFTFLKLLTQTTDAFFAEPFFLTGKEIGSLTESRPFRRVRN